MVWHLWLFQTPQGSIEERAKIRGNLISAKCEHFIFVDQNDDFGYAIWLSKGIKF